MALLLTASLRNENETELRVNQTITSEQEEHSRYGDRNTDGRGYAVINTM